MDEQSIEKHIDIKTYESENKQKNSFLNSNRINETNKMDEQLIEKHIEIKTYESENNKKDSVV